MAGMFSRRSRRIWHGAVAPPQFGRLISDYVRAGFSEPVQTGTATWRGAVLAVDRFGNLITNFPVAQFPELTLTAGKRRVTRLVDSYAEGAPGELVVIAGSSGFYEIACNQASAAQRTGCAAGAEINLTMVRRTVPGRGSGAR